MRTKKRKERNNAVFQKSQIQNENSPIKYANRDEELRMKFLCPDMDPEEIRKTRENRVNQNARRYTRRVRWKGLHRLWYKLFQMWDKDDIRQPILFEQEDASDEKNNS